MVSCLIFPRCQCDYATAWRLLCERTVRCGSLQLRDRAAISDFLKAPMHNPMVKASQSAVDDDDAVCASFARPLTAVCVKPAPKAAVAALQRLKTPESDEEEKEEVWVNSRELRMRQMCNAPPVNCAICARSCLPSQTHAVTYGVLLTHFLTHGSALGCELLGMQVPFRAAICK